jgi:hypothetical protein
MRTEPLCNIHNGNPYPKLRPHPSPAHARMLISRQCPVLKGLSIEIYDVRLICSCSSWVALRLVHTIDHSLVWESPLHVLYPSSLAISCTRNLAMVQRLLEMLLSFPPVWFEVNTETLIIQSLASTGSHVLHWTVTFPETFHRLQVSLLHHRYRKRTCDRY